MGHNWRVDHLKVVLRTSCGWWYLELSHSWWVRFCFSFSDTALYLPSFEEMKATIIDNVLAFVSSKMLLQNSLLFYSVLFKKIFFFVFFFFLQLLRQLWFSNSLLKLLVVNILGQCYWEFVILSSSVYLGFIWNFVDPFLGAISGFHATVCVE